MKLHKTLIKRKKSFDLNHQKNKFVLFIGENRTLDSEVPLHNDIKDVIKKFINKKVFKDLPTNNAIYLDNPLTLDPDFILIIKVKNCVDDKDLYEFGKIISKFKERNTLSIIWTIGMGLDSIARTIQLRSYVFNKLKSDNNRTKMRAETIFFVDEKYKYSKIDLSSNDALAEGVFLCRDLINLPANILNTKKFENELKSLKKIGVKVTVLNEKEIKAIGMNLLFAIGKGSDSPSKVVVL